MRGFYLVLAVVFSILIDQLSADNIVSSNRIYVDETADNSINAKERAFQKALAKACVMIFGKDVDKKSLHYSFSVLKEKISDQRYQAILQFQFHLSDNAQPISAPTETMLSSATAGRAPGVDHHEIYVRIATNITNWIDHRRLDLANLNLTHTVIYASTSSVTVKVRSSGAAFMAAARNAGYIVTEESADVFVMN